MSSRKATVKTTRTTQKKSSINKPTEEDPAYIGRGTNSAHSGTEVTARPRRAGPGRKALAGELATGFVTENAEFELATALVTMAADISATEQQEVEKELTIRPREDGKMDIDTFSAGKPRPTAPAARLQPVAATKKAKSAKRKASVLESSDSEEDFSKDPNFNESDQEASESSSDDEAEEDEEPPNDKEELNQRRKEDNDDETGPQIEPTTNTHKQSRTATTKKATKGRPLANTPYELLVAFYDMRNCMYIASFDSTTSLADVLKRIGNKLDVSPELIETSYRLMGAAASSKTDIDGEDGWRRIVKFVADKLSRSKTEKEWHVHIIHGFEEQPGSAAKKAKEKAAQEKAVHANASSFLAKIMLRWACAAHKHQCYRIQGDELKLNEEEQEAAQAKAQEEAKANGVSSTPVPTEVPAELIGQCLHLEMYHQTEWAEAMRARVKGVTEEKMPRDLFLKVAKPLLDKHNERKEKQRKEAEKQEKTSNTFEPVPPKPRGTSGSKRAPVPSPAPPAPLALEAQQPPPSTPPPQQIQTPWGPASFVNSYPTQNFPGFSQSHGFMPAPYGFPMFIQPGMLDSPTKQLLGLASGSGAASHQGEDYEGPALETWLKQLDAESGIPGSTRYQLLWVNLSEAGFEHVRDIIRWKPDDIARYSGCTPGLAARLLEKATNLLKATRK